jgi:hypothetical protein
MRRFLNALVSVALFSSISPGDAAEFRWTGMRNPCKQSAEDGLDSSQLGRKIGAFVALADQHAWAQAIFNVQNRFPQSTPWVTWSVGQVRDSESLTDEQHEAYLSHMDALGVAVFLELAPNRDDDVATILSAWLDKLKHHPCIQGAGVDLEFFRRLDDDTAREWDELVKAAGADYRLFLKHWDESFMPSAYRGAGDLIFINTSSEATVEALNEEFAAWARRFAPSAVAFQVGYPSDEDGMDGDNAQGWWRLDDPIRNWGASLLSAIGDTDQEIGFLWVTVKSGKTYNAHWDLTHGAIVPEPAK